MWVRRFNAIIELRKLDLISYSVQRFSYDSVKMSLFPFLLAGFWNHQVSTLS